MRPEKAYYIIKTALENYMTKRHLMYSRDMLQACIKLYKKCMKVEHDYRTGEETYGYETRELIEQNIHYISDRFYCQFRLKWLIDGINMRKF